MTAATIFFWLMVRFRHAGWGETPDCKTYAPVIMNRIPQKMVQP